MKNIDISASEYRRMTLTPIPRLVLSLALPTVVSMLVTSAYNLADTYFVTKLGNSAIGSVGVVFSLQSIIQAVGFGFGMGSGSLVSRSLGARDNEAAHRYATSAFLCGILFGLIIMVVGLTNLEGLMILFGSTPTILPYACDYGTFILLSAPVMCSTFVLNCAARSEGKALFSMIAIGSGAVINIVLDPVLIFGAGLGVKGAAIATAISQVVSFAVFAVFFGMKRGIVRIAPRYISRDIRDYLLIIKTGLPTIFRQGLGSFATVLLNNQVCVYGDAAVAAVSIANKIYMLLRNSIMGIGQGFQPVAGYNYGAGKYSRVKGSFAFAVAVGSIISCMSAVLSLFFGGEIVSLFRPEGTEVLEIGRKMLFYMSFSLPVLAYSTYVNQLYQCLGFVKGATFLACCRQGVFFIPLVLILPRLIGLDGIQSVQAFSDILTFIVSVPFNIWFYKKLIPQSDVNTEKTQ